MAWFLIPLLIGFACNSASTFTTFFSGKLGGRKGRLVCIVLRDILGIPVWAIGYAIAVLAGSAYIFTPSLLSRTFAGMLILVGAASIIAGMISLRWRAAAPSINDTLVVSGLYAYIRHPLYSGMLLELIGLFLWVPGLTVLVACLLGMLWTLGQARLEELDLLHRLPAYREYMQKVPRFAPKIW